MRSARLAATRSDGIPGLRNPAIVGFWAWPAWAAKTAPASSARAAGLMSNLLFRKTNELVLERNAGGHRGRTAPRARDRRRRTGIDAAAADDGEIGGIRHHFGRQEGRPVGDL